MMVKHEELEIENIAELDDDVIEAVVATVDRRFQPRLGLARQELEASRQKVEALESERSRTIERYVERLRGEAPRNGSTQTNPTDGTAIVRPPRGSNAQQNGSRTLPTRKKMLLEVLPEFGGRWFRRRDADTKILKRWPQVQPKSKAQSKTFPAANARLLSELVAEGRLESRKLGEGKFAPAEYRVINNLEGTLLGSEP